MDDIYPPPDTCRSLALTRTLTLASGKADVCDGCFRIRGSGNVTGHSSMQPASPLRELACRTRSHSVTCHPTEVAFQPLPRPKLVLDLATSEGRLQS